MLIIIYTQLLVSNNYCSNTRWLLFFARTIVRRLYVFHKNRIYELKLREYVILTKSTRPEMNSVEDHSPFDILKLSSQKPIYFILEQKSFGARVSKSKNQISGALRRYIKNP